MIVYASCYYADGKQILGTMDGQAVINAKNYRRTNAYKRIKAIVAKYSPTGPWPWNRTHHACVEFRNGDIIERIG